MIHVVVISHGDFCEGLLSSLKMIAGDTFGVKAVPLVPGESPESYREKLANVLSSYANEDSEFIILSDIGGGTPFQSAAYLSKEFKIGLVSGMNMPMLLTLALGRTEEDKLDSLIERATSKDCIGIQSKIFGRGERKQRAKLSINKN
ncbi:MULTISPECIES: PTS sugar transporter subunit IIA [Enterococcus]|uniref:PTS sugar transporter subunit IIA n=1 Tax=Enterococcus raffinosus TaxID=71452 RepID=A0AAP5KCU2_9ENTE|nr:MULTISPECIES: PTS sugar transporter subunit IIA [Enterococcus]SBA11265.1 PTS system, mannose/fructose/sorbose-specific IIAB component [Enterococcus faecium]MBS6429856.1 PTS sugar transporter subunit IIA [Enterococcus raffinosus]MDK7991248.1 PTS sugar transporter subunit IIA [Enterococcus raffinosus]MDT2524145.1 PTS sugar transporter subunit IIA [Enterococcus raffinosus]MDT2534874.1 PTS sugar transporter subunit IIA [Enterococcus raffinosus]